ncbi:PREDICTED: NADH dehydrogenase [ubiquinone] 1 beta subcomplex subunit 8, mitochondrial-like [Priapulus caudatus]|uniref:NADH dehydrogenase [ubiquinone] 1 beta subcomplex subunit 8, mitochondrial-like n=1 Tax=Priapulus caudatus TaxID=37621 RepID=A0ABM1F0V1_PRICU|nr:PREDICTED: NADH dehydrogenase [ubiquinone] 1 beta subcomplex subunit 8, mitochondrial-like [Priapulus caudatus]
MAALIRAGFRLQCKAPRNLGILGAQPVRTGYWNKDWKPGPYPKTAEEREAAAKKYGMRPEDYDVYPDDGMGYGDYPKIEAVSGESRNPYYNWDYPYLRKDYGEPLHVDADLYGEDRINVSGKLRYSINQQFAALFGVVTVFGILFLLGQRYKLYQPLLPKQFPYGGLWVENGHDPATMPDITHYTFEPVE